MRSLFLFVILLCLIGCEGARDIIPYVDNRIRGTYDGNFIAIYPGPDAGEIIVNDSINIIFTDAFFSYYWMNDIDTLTDGRGAYILESNVDFQNEIEPTTNPPITIDGVFSIRWGRADTAPDTLFLEQINFQDGNSIIDSRYLITLVKSDEQPND